MAKMFPSRVGHDGVPGRLRHSGLRSHHRTAELHDPLDGLIERLDVDVVHPAARPRDRPEQQPSADPLGLSGAGVDAPVVDAGRLFDLPPEQRSVELRELRRVLGINLEVRH